MPIHAITPKSLEKAAALLAEGRVIALPTETVYGLAADAGNAAAVAALYALKGREETKPCQVLAASAELALSLGEFSTVALALARRFWPGALTLIVRRKEGAPLAAAVSPGVDTVGLRVPDHSVTQALLKLFGAPLAASSANPAGKPPARTAAEVAAYYPELYILDGGMAEHGVASTVADCTGTEIKIVREGAISVSALQAACR